MTTRRALTWSRRAPRDWNAPVASVRGLAAHYGVSERTALRWVEQGRIRGAFRAPEGWWLPTYQLTGTRTAHAPAARRLTPRRRRDVLEDGPPDVAAMRATA